MIKSEDAQWSEALREPAPDMPKYIKRELRALKVEANELAERRALIKKKIRAIQRQYKKSIVKGDAL